LLVHEHIEEFGAMYAVVEDGSRQYRVSTGDIVRLDHREAEVGSKFELDQVLLVKTDSELHLGKPKVEGAKVIVEVVGHPSIKHYIQKYRRRKNYRRLTGHRQYYVAVKVKEVLLAGQTASS
jgi:large subunit ribosomal protein L21